MKQHSTMKTMAALALLAASLTFVACNNAYGVLSGIQTEKAQVGSTLFKNATVKAVGEDRVNYYAVMSKVYYRTFAASSWTLLPVKGVSDYYTAGFASDAASSPGRVWVASMDPTGSTLYGVYASSDGGSTWSSALDVSLMSLSSTMTLDALYWAGDTLFALVHDHMAKTYSLYYSDGATAFATVSITNYGTEKTQPILSVVKAGTSYWALTQARVYKGTTNSTFAADTTSGTPTGTIITSTSGSVLGGIAVTAAGSVHVTRSDGLLFTLASGPWTNATVLDSIKLGVLAEVPTTTAVGSPYRLIIAKHNSTYGYCEWNASTSTEVAGNDSSAIFSPTSSGYTTTVYDKPVTALYYSAAKGTILIGLAAQGSDTYALYSNTYSGSAWSGWTAE